MTTTVEAIYEAGLLRPLKQLALHEHARVRLLVQELPYDAERAAWLAQSEDTLMKAWGNDADDVYNDLLAP